MVEVRVPADALNADVLDAVLVNAPSGRLQRVMVGNAKLAVAAVDGDTHPQLVGLDEREDLLVSERLDVANDQELLPVFHKLGDVLVEKGEGRVGHDDVRLLQKRDALKAAEIAPGVLVICFQGYPGGLVSFKEKLDVGHVRRAVAV